MATTTTPIAITKNVTLTIDGREVTVPDGTTVLGAAKQLGIDIPVLCHDDRYDPVGVCRMCVVDVGARVLMDDLAVLEHEQAVGDVEREAQHLLGHHDAEPALVADALERARR